MGQEIASLSFSAEDFAEFAAQLQQETDLLARWLAGSPGLDPACQPFAQGALVGGFELEAWLITAQGDPHPINQSYLEAVNSPLVVPELAQFNVEINSQPQVLTGSALQQFHQELSQTWEHCCQVADQLQAGLIMIGILPTVRQEQLTLEMISPRKRYIALNEQILNLHQHRQRLLGLDIQGVGAADSRGEHDHLRILHPDIMLEAATTSFQIHLQVPPDQAARFFNASLILAAPLVAVGANSPYLFGKDLWAETRIPLFEQALDGPPPLSPTHHPRVTLGQGYVQGSLMELFLENLQRYPVLLPQKLGSPLSELAHLRLHNGTIWRWNRPLIGLDPVPHVRIEQRVVAAGPTVPDMIANAAFYFGLTQALGSQPVPPEHDLSFAQCRTNFYAAARLGLDAPVTWLNGWQGSLRQLLLKELLPLAEAGLAHLNLAQTDLEEYLGIIRARAESGQNGATWQRRYVARHGKDMQQLTCAYWERQRQGCPVHTWDLA
ncbi:glutamate-cysteine ligase family protein [Synechococcus sp. Nb3U1]|uniref:glutamate-cysteine ligase family protein n=1 Tax=Synechococcus sp. Nb3U1 TaxID=1914529 RepID=UPI001F2EF123|nr:glutamate-cysteine ligase family protein [Synechococcus sp. Nb3U1]MCF2969994.1 glutamate-cysteine ligase family protein [Synechococcus sp. Nb3U1]